MSEESRKSYLTKIWCGMCNFYGSISGNSTCSKCPFKDDSEMCYDDEYCDYDKFEEFIKGIKLIK